MRWRWTGRQSLRGRRLHHRGRGRRQLHRQMERQRLVGPGHGDEQLGVYALAVTVRATSTRGRLHHGGRESPPTTSPNGTAAPGRRLGCRDERLWSMRWRWTVGHDLYAGGGFTTAGGVAANRIAKWNGSAWSALGSGMNGAVYALAVAVGTTSTRGEASPRRAGSAPTASPNGTAAPGRPWARG